MLKLNANQRMRQFKANKGMTNTQGITAAFCGVVFYKFSGRYVITLPSLSGLGSSCLPCGGHIAEPWHWPSSLTPPFWFYKADAGPQISNHIVELEPCGLSSHPPLSHEYILQKDLPFFLLKRWSLLCAFFLLLETSIICNAVHSAGTSCSLQMDEAKIYYHQNTWKLENGLMETINVLLSTIRWMVDQCSILMYWRWFKMIKTLSLQYLMGRKQARQGQHSYTLLHLWKKNPTII